MPNLFCKEKFKAALLILTPFDTNWKKGSGATPLTTQDLFFGDAISIPTAPTNLNPVSAVAWRTGNGAAKSAFALE
jgi:hypothetical protein